MQNLQKFPQTVSKDATEKRLEKEKADEITREKLKKEKLRGYITHEISRAKELPLTIPLSSFRVTYVVADDIGLELESEGWCPTFELDKPNDDGAIFINCLVLN